MLCDSLQAVTMFSLYCGRTQQQVEAMVFVEEDADAQYCSVLLRVIRVAATTITNESLKKSQGHC
jgi:hypothetical protein